MRQHKDINISTPTYSAHFEWRDDSLLYTERTVFRSQARMETYALGMHWSLYRVTPGNQPIGFGVGDRSVVLTGPHFIFCPPFSIVNVQFGGNSVLLRAIASCSPLSSRCPSDCVVFPAGPQSLPSSTAQALTWLEGIARQPLHVLPDAASRTARRIKRMIDATYRDAISMREVAGELGIDAASLSRVFRAAYRMSAVSYRSKLRVIDAAWQMLRGDHTVLHTGFEVGFGNTSQFIRQFKHEMNSAPSAYLRH